MKYRKKPVVIEAMQFTGHNGADIATALEIPEGYISINPGALMITTSEGIMRADVLDWIIKGIKGEFYPCKPDIFEATYEACSTETP